MMRVFLTGGTGFIGQPLTQSLIRRGWEVTVLVRKPESPHAQYLSKFGASLAKGDVTDRDSMRTSMSGADIVVHNAGLYEYGLDAAGSQHAQEINVQGTINTLGLAHELGIQRSGYVSSVCAFGDPGHTSRDETFRRKAPYYTSDEWTKTQAHEIAHQYQNRGLPLPIFCPNGVIGTNDHSVMGYLLRFY